MIEIVQSEHLAMYYCKSDLLHWIPGFQSRLHSFNQWETLRQKWETELPPNYDRVGLENFIRAKYEEKRWVSKDGIPNSPPRTKVVLVTRPQPDLLKAEAVPQAETVKVVETHVVLPPKPDLAEDIFNKLSMDDGPSESSTESAANDDA